MAIADSYDNCNDIYAIIKIIQWDNNDKYNNHKDNDFDNNDIDFNGYANGYNDNG